MWYHFLQLVREVYRPIHHMNFSAFAGWAARIQPQEHEMHGRLVQTYVLIQSFKEQLPLVVKQCLFHASNKSDHLQLRPEDAIILQFLSCLGDVTSWNIPLYQFLLLTCLFCSLFLFSLTESLLCHLIYHDRNTLVLIDILGIVESRSSWPSSNYRFGKKVKGSW